MTGELDLDTIHRLLGRSSSDPEVASLILGAPSGLEVVQDRGFVELKTVGISVMFKHIRSMGNVAASLRVFALHLHRSAHEGHQAYGGALPFEVSFADDATTVAGKAGTPIRTGGGGMSALLRKPIPQWLEYELGAATVHFQLDESGRVEMVTLYLSDDKVQASHSTNLSASE